MCDFVCGTTCMSRAKLSLHWSVVHVGTLSGDFCVTFWAWFGNVNCINITGFKLGPDSGEK